MQVGHRRSVSASGSRTAALRFEHSDIPIFRRVIDKSYVRSTERLFLRGAVSSCVISDSSRDRLFLLAVEPAVVLGPVVILVLTRSALVLLGYSVHRPTLWTVGHEGRSSLDTTEHGEVAERFDETSEPSEER
jgi:hypothetical protein